ncbi:hypothetical protein O6H91_12G022800 [Diphasiastrum complanatum]|uniref:Uncharacterized protein n=1 Tax=Diphasiastrum complanatum TaxID=34168 RepID=A0ACC2BZP6_DIPCM|nr:hypothetical protein O6H91_12G022800 [Diphasiastrum complanatum]
MLKGHCIAPINDISFQHQFKIANNVGGITLLWGKQFSNSVAWLPSKGVHFFYLVCLLLKLGLHRPLTSVLEEQKTQREHWLVNPFAALNFLETTIQAAYQLLMSLIDTVDGFF